jgi:hypothetical protein
VDRYDELWADARPAVLRRELVVEAGPRGRERWPLSVILRLDESTARTFAGLTAELTGLIGAAYAFDHHVTVRALAPPTHGLTAGDQRLAGYADALREATMDLGPVRLRFDGLTATALNVLACGYPADDTAEALRYRLAGALAARGLDGFERDVRRTTWHATLLTYGRQPADAHRLAAWIEARRHHRYGVATCATVQVAAWDAADRQIALPLATVRLSDGRVSETVFTD